MHSGYFYADQLDTTRWPEPEAQIVAGLCETAGMSRKEAEATLLYVVDGHGKASIGLHMKVQRQHVNRFLRKAGLKLAGRVPDLREALERVQAVRKQEAVWILTLFRNAVQGGQAPRLTVQGTDQGGWRVVTRPALVTPAELIRSSTEGLDVFVVARS